MSDPLRADGPADQSTDPNSTYWGRYKGRWRQCFLALFALGFVLVVVGRLDEVHNATNLIALAFAAFVGGIGDGLLVGSIVCFLVAIPRSHDQIV
jgi:hypothetical protein